MRRIVSGLLLIAALAVILAACGPEPAAADPKAAADAYLKHMSERNYAEAYKLLSADTQATITAGDFQKMVEDAWQSAGITAFQVKEVKEAILSESGYRASVPYQATLTTSAGSTDVYNALSLVLQENQWRVIWPPAR